MTTAAGGLVIITVPRSGTAGEPPRQAGHAATGIAARRQAYRGLGTGEFARANGDRAWCCSGSLAASRLGQCRGGPGSPGRVPFLRRL